MIAWYVVDYYVIFKVQLNVQRKEANLHSNGENNSFI